MSRHQATGRKLRDEILSSRTSRNFHITHTNPPFTRLRVCGVVCCRCSDDDLEDLGRHHQVRLRQGLDHRRAPVQLAHLTPAARVEILDEPALPRLLRVLGGGCLGFGLRLGLGLGLELGLV